MVFLWLVLGRDMLILGLMKPLGTRHPVKIEKDTNGDTDAIKHGRGDCAYFVSDRVCFDRRWDLCLLLNRAQ